MEGTRPAKRVKRAPTPAEAALRLQATYRGFRTRCEGLTSRRRAQTEARLAAAAAATEAALAARARSPEYRALARHCPQVDVAKLARVDADLEALVGLQPLKEYCASVRRDCLARAALGEAPMVRNVLISGNLGVGKKLAAATICALLRALGVAKGMKPTETTLESMVLDVRRDLSCVVVDGLGAIEGARGKVDAVLANYPDHCFIFVGPTAQAEALHGAVTHFRKVDCAWLQLPNYTPAELAQITARQVERRGYALADALGPHDLQAAISAIWSRDVVAMRNAHLASELVQRAYAAPPRRRVPTTLT